MSEDTINQQIGELYTIIHDPTRSEEERQEARQALEKLKATSELAALLIDMEDEEADQAEDGVPAHQFFGRLVEHQAGARAGAEVSIGRHACYPY